MTAINFWQILLFCASISFTIGSGFVQGAGGNIFMRLQSQLQTLAKSKQESTLTCEIVESAILNFMPWAEMHHIVVIRDTSEPGAYTLDFSPLNQTSPSTLLKMLFGKSVPGEIRVRYIPEKDLSYDEIKNNCMCADLSLSTLSDMFSPARLTSMGVLSHVRKQFVKLPPAVKKLSSVERDQYRITRTMVKNKKVADAVLKVKNNWNTNMNLYFHNCQHFSYVARKTIAELS